jgi:gliding motility-associated-like protein
VVTNTNDVGAGSFREAIICANSNPGPDTITFNIPGAQAQKVIQPLTTLPAVTDGSTVVDATTQPFGEVFLDGTLLGPFETGLSFQADSCELYGLRVFGFGQYGVEFGGVINHVSNVVVGSPAKGNEIYECGTCLLVYGQNDVLIQSNILGNRGSYTQGTLPNNYGGDVVLTSNSTNVLIGGDKTAGEGNVFVNSSIAGLQVRSADGAEPVRIFGNYVGIDPSETIIQPNGLANSPNHGAITLTVIGGSRVGDGSARHSNIIAHNQGVGIFALFDGHRFRHNSFYCNTDGGIDLDSQGQNANQNKAAPVFTVTNVNALQGTAVPLDTVEVYLHDNADCPDAPCQGKILLGTAVASVTGTWFINGPFARPLQNQDEVTALATGTDGNSSAFSPCSQVCPDVDITVSNDGPYCTGDTIRLFADIGGAMGNLRYSWVGPGGYLSNERNPTDATRAGTYTFQLNIGGCLYPFEETEVVIGQRDTLRIDSTICNNSRLNIGGEIFDINRDSGDVRLVNRFGCDSIIEVRLDFSNIDLAVFRDTLCEGESRMIGGVLYDINNPSGGDTLINQDGCDSIISVELVFRSVSRNDITRDLCFGDSLVVNGRTYDENNPAGSDTLVNSVGCDSIITVALSFSNARVESIDTTICEGDFLIINGQRYDEDNLGGADTIPSGASNGCDSVIQVNLTVSSGGRLVVDTILCDGRFLEYNGIRYDEFYPRGRDTIFGGSASGCDSIIDVDITFFQPDFTIDTIQPTCGGRSDGAIIIRNISGIPGPYTYTLNGVGPIDITTFPDTISNLDEGSYFIVVSDSTDCGHLIQLTLEESGNIDITVNPEVVIMGGESTTLTYQTDFPPDSVFWIANGDTLCRDCPDLTVAPTQTTTYEIWVYRSGCSASATIRVRVENIFNIYVPNAFSPDGNNINDRFTIFSSAPGVIIENMEIYTRWGELVYQGLNMDPANSDTGWDGTFQGERLDPGVYVYRLVISLPGGQKENYAGEITLIW